MRVRVTAGSSMWRHLLFEREKGGNWLRIVSGVCTRKTSGLALGFGLGLGLGFALALALTLTCTRKTSSSLTHAASMYTSTCERWRERRVDGAIAWLACAWRAGSEDGARVACG